MAVIPFPRDTRLQTKHRVSHLIILKVKLSHASVHTDQRQAINGDIVSNWPFPTRAVPQMRVWIWAHSIILQIVTLTTFEINAAYSRVSSVRSCQAPNISSRLTNFSLSWSTCKKALLYIPEDMAIHHILVMSLENTLITAPDNTRNLGVILITRL